MTEEKENFIFLDFYGMKIPIDTVFNRRIKKRIREKIREVLNSEDFPKTIANFILTNKYFKEKMRPIIKEAIEDDDVKIKITFREEDET